MKDYQYRETDGFGGIVAPQVGELKHGPRARETTNFHSAARSQAALKTGIYSGLTETQLGEPDKTAMESELATMSGCILALSEHTSAERHRILHTISAFFED